MPSQFRTLTAAALLVTASSALFAQADPDSVRHRNDCRLADQVLTKGQPAPKTSWALMVIRSCGDVDQAVAFSESVRRSHSNQTAAEIGPMVTSARWVRDARLFQAVMDLAQDRQAATVARVYAFMALAMLKDDRAEPTYQVFTLGLDSRGEVARTPCGGRRASPVSGFVIGSQPLPMDYRTRIRSMARQVHANAAEPIVVRGAAACTHGGYLTSPPPN